MEGLINKFFEFKKKITWPEVDDLKGAIHGLLRIQYTYRLEAVDVAKGLLRGRQTLARLSPEDCLFLAEGRLQGDDPLRKDHTKEYALAIEWVEAAVQ